MQGLALGQVWGTFPAHFVGRKPRNEGDMARKRAETGRRTRRAGKAGEGEGAGISTREAVRRARKADPDITAAELARGLGISRQAVAEHLDALGLPRKTGRSDALKGAPAPGSTHRAMLHSAERKVLQATAALAEAMDLLRSLAELFQPE